MLAKNTLRIVVSSLIIVLILLIGIPLIFDTAIICDANIANAQNDNPCLAQEATISAMMIEYQHLSFQATLDSGSYQGTITALESEVVPSITSVATREEGANTPPGTILEVGETWYQDGASLTLTDVVLSPGSYYGDFHMQFEFRNETTSPLIFEFPMDTFTAVDNLGNHFTDPHFHQLPGTFGCRPTQNLIDPGERIVFCEGHRLFLKGNITNSQVTEIIVAVREISRIQNAKWHFPITH
ncbi:MAG: hypothetical protein CL607_10040 [Anaerolineaceae bacterium]|nr:hypothetical protein [Anaerolineaceae bacterium]